MTNICTFIEFLLSTTNMSNLVCYFSLKDLLLINTNLTPISTLNVDNYTLYEYATEIVVGAEVRYVVPSKQIGENDHFRISRK